VEKTSDPVYHGPRRPLLILSFDEAHQLTETYKDGQWSVFSGLRRALRDLGKRTETFSLFLSTFGNFTGFIPEVNVDISARVILGKMARHPIITEVGFDTFAYPVTWGKTTLEDVSSVDFMSRYGRPL
jgi:hypothetical protein